MRIKASKSKFGFECLTRNLDPVFFYCQPECQLYLNFSHLFSPFPIVSSNNILCSHLSAFLYWLDVLN